MKKINWEKIADKLQIKDVYSTEDAKKALEIIIGEKNLVSAVDYYINSKPHSELVRFVLRLINPASATNRCYEIYKFDTDIERKRSAIELLRIVADKSVLPKIKEFINDNDEEIQSWGAGILDYLIYRNKVDIDDCKSELELIKNHKNKNVREIYNTIMEYSQ